MTALNNLLNSLLLVWYVANLAIVALVAGYYLHHKASERGIVIGARLLLLFCCLCGIGQVLIGAQTQVEIVTVAFTFSVAVLGVHYIFAESREESTRLGQNERPQIKLPGNKNAAVNR